MNIFVRFLDKKNRLEPMVIGGKQKKRRAKASCNQSLCPLQSGLPLESHLAAVPVVGSA
jgi:hypothetical protein